MCKERNILKVLTKLNESPGCCVARKKPITHMVYPQTPLNGAKTGSRSQSRAHPPPEPQGVETRENLLPQPGPLVWRSSNPSVASASRAKERDSSDKAPVIPPGPWQTAGGVLTTPPPKLCQWAGRGLQARFAPGGSSHQP